MVTMPAGERRSLTAGSHMLVTTFRRSGEPVSAPVWVVPVSDGRVGRWTGYETGKARRLRRDPRVRVQACTARGRVRPGAPAYGTGAVRPP